MPPGGWRGVSGGVGQRDGGRYTTCSMNSAHAFRPSMNGSRNASPLYWSILGNRTTPSSASPYLTMISRASDASTKSDSAGSARDQSSRAATNAYTVVHDRQGGGSFGSKASSFAHVSASAR